MMDNRFSRRTIVKAGLMAGMFVPTFIMTDASAAATTLPPLDVNDPTAKALGFVNDSSKVDATANPLHTAAQKCSTCAQYQGQPGDARGGCNIFVGKSVPAGGWCKTWAKKA